MGLFNFKKKSFNREELMELHNLLTEIFNKKTFKETEKDDARYLRMKTKEIFYNRGFEW